MLEIKVTIGSYTITHAHKPRRIDGANYTTTIPLEIPLETAVAIIEEIIDKHLNGVSWENIIHDIAQGRYGFSVEIKPDFDVKGQPKEFYHQLDEIALMKRLATKITNKDIKELLAQKKQGK